MPTKVPTKPWAGCAGKIDHGGARKSAREGVATSVRQRTQGFVRAGAPGGGGFPGDRESACVPGLGGGGYFTTGIFRCGKFRISNVCEISPLNSQTAMQNKLVSKCSHLGASPPCLVLVRVLLPLSLVARRHPMASSLAVFEALHFISTAELALINPKL